MIKQKAAAEYQIKDRINLGTANDGASGYINTL